MCVSLSDCQCQNKADLNDDINVHNLLLSFDSSDNPAISCSNAAKVWCSDAAKV